MLVGAGLPEGGLPVRLPWGDHKGRPYERFYFRGSLFMTDSIIAVDLGGTRLRTALCSPDGTIQKRIEKKTKAQRGPQAVMERVIQTIHQVWPQQGTVQAISIVAPGPLDPFEGVVIEAPNLPDWDHVPVRDILTKAFSLPVFVGNDANLAALAEHRFGAGQGLDDLIYMTISTGVGGGIILGGKLLLGSKGLAGEIGHMIVQPGGPLCGCGNRGCLEAVASGTAIGREARVLVSGGKGESILQAAGGDREAVESRSVGQAAAKGDPLAIKLLADAGRNVGIAIASLMHLFNPQRFILGGGVSQAGDLLFEPVRESAREWAMSPLYWQGVDILPAALGDDVGLLGALALALTEME